VLLQALVAETSDARLDQSAERLFAHRQARQPPGDVPHTPASQADSEKDAPAEQEQPEIAGERKAYRQSMTEMPAKRLVFLDESGATKMARTYAWAPRGQRAYGSIALGSGQRLTVLGALTCECLVATMSIEASTSTPVLLAYLEQVLEPKLQLMKPDAILVMDNLRPHRATTVRELLDQAGIGLLYLPRYFPEFNPIEHAWGKMKERLKAKAARSLEALEAELKPALDTITARDAQGWLPHADYVLH
jgi:transposase